MTPFSINHKSFNLGISPSKTKGNIKYQFKEPFNCISKIYYVIPHILAWNIHILVRELFHSLNASDLIDVEPLVDRNFRGCFIMPTHQCTPVRTAQTIYAIKQTVVKPSNIKRRTRKVIKN